VAGKAVAESNSRCGEQATSKDTQGNPSVGRVAKKLIPIKSRRKLKTIDK